MRKVIIRGVLIVCLLLVSSVSVEALAPSQLECSWCGSQCLLTSMMRFCPEVGTPPIGKSCSYVNGACTIKSTVSVTPTKKVTPSISVTPTAKVTPRVSATPTAVAKCNWCGNRCTALIMGLMCPNVEPPAGMICKNVAGKCVVASGPTVAITPTCVPRPACLDLPQPCLIQIKPEYCPKSGSPTPTKSVTPTCVPRPACLDLPQPCLIPEKPEYCPKVNQGDANGDGKVDLVDFSIWKGEYANGVAGMKADFDKNGKVDLVDFSIWKVSYSAVK